MRRWAIQEAEKPPDSIRLLELPSKDPPFAQLNQQALQVALARQKQELVRSQSLQRAMRSAMGISLAQPKDARPEPGKRKPKRPSVRALKAVKVLRAGLEDAPQAIAPAQEVKA